MIKINKTKEKLTVTRYQQGKEVMPQDRYQTVQDVADRLDVAAATVRQWIKTGALRISDTDLVQVLKTHETAPCPPGNRPSRNAEKEYDDEPPR